jgi:hypothetical protein
MATVKRIGQETKGETQAVFYELQASAGVDELAAM